MIGCQSNVKIYVKQNVRYEARYSVRLNAGEGVREFFRIYATMSDMYQDECHEGDHTR